MQWIVSQIGARQHYGVPRGFQYQDQLRLMYTEAWCPRMFQFLRYGPKSARAFAGRYHPHLRRSQVHSFNFLALRDGLQRAVFGKPKTTEEQFHDFLRFGRIFDRRVMGCLEPIQLDPAKDHFFSFNTGCLESLRFLNDRNVFTVVDQIDPARTEEEIVRSEGEKWPGWEALPGRVPEEYWQRMSDEWDAAKLVLANSHWSRNALIKQGVSPGKVFVVPVAFEPEPGPLIVHGNTDKPLSVLWLGGVNLRKGIQYLIEAAKLLTKTAIKFTVAGPVMISEKAVQSAPSSMSFVGKVNRDEAARYYREADVFVLPTMSDGFAITQVEAMAQGLPVITTPNCGEVVTDGRDGLIVPAGDGPALAAAIARLDADRAMLQQMSIAARLRSTTFMLPVQAQHVERAVNMFRQTGSVEHLPAFSETAAMHTGK